MTSPTKPWELNSLQNSTHILRSSNACISPDSGAHSIPALPPVPRSLSTPSPYNSYMPYSSGFSNLGYNAYGSYGMPYRNSLYSTYGGYGGYNNYGIGGYQGYGMDDTERRFIQYAEERSRNAFANVESVVRMFNSISMMLDNTFFAMTSSFRAVLSMAENFGKLRNMFGHIWYSINLFRLFSYLYRKLMWLLGRKVPKSATSVAWYQAAEGTLPNRSLESSNWPTLAFLGVLIGAPYIISKFLPKHEDKTDPASWKSPGVKAKAAFDFVARASNELTLHTNDVITLAPTYIQEEMNLKNTGWAFAIANERCGLVPLNYLVIMKTAVRSSNNNNQVPVPRVTQNGHKSHTKRVSFGENQVFENVDLDDYVTVRKDTKPTENSHVEKEDEIIDDSSNKMNCTGEAESNQVDNA